MSTPPRPPGKTLYDILGIAATASPEEVSAAYRARQAEIDARADPDPAAALAVREAFQLLSSPERRKRYDAGLSIVVAVSEAVTSDPPPNRRLLLGVVIFAVVAGLIGARMMASSTKPAVVPAPKVGVRAPEPEPAKSEPETTAEIKASDATASGVQAAPEPPPSRRFVSENKAPELSWFSIPALLMRNAQGKFSGRASGVTVRTDTVITTCQAIAGASRITTEDAVASVETADEELGLCRLKMRNFYERRLLEPAPLSEVRPGQKVYALGAPWQTESAPTEGTVIALTDVGSGVMIQLSMFIPPGWDGGGLFATDGSLIGVLTASFRHRNGMNLAIPAERISQMKARSSGPAPTVIPPAEGIPGVLRGKWTCSDPWDHRTGDYDYGPDGKLRIRLKSGREDVSAYRVEGMSVRYGTAYEQLTLQIESVGTDRMIQYTDVAAAGGERMTCERSEGIGLR